MTIDHQVRPDHRTESEAVDAFYGGLFGWTIRRHGGRLFLALENGLCAVTLPKLSAGPVRAHLSALGCDGPSLILPTQQGPRLAILAEADGQLLLRGSLPADVQVLDCGALLPLPAGPQLPGVGPEWLTAPDPRHRWLPTVSAVLAGLPQRR